MHNKSIDDSSRRPAVNVDPAKEKRHRNVRRVLYILLLICCSLVFSWTGYAASYIAPLLWGDLNVDEVTNTTTSSNAEVTDEPLLNGQMTVVLVGWDHRPGETTGRSDTLMVAFVDVDQNLVRLLSIPRDTYVNVPGHGMTKINHAFAYGGIELSIETLRENFNIQPDYYAAIDFNGFIDVIDAVGGVTIDVPMKMHKESENINLEAGLQTLDGPNALAFVRWRSDGTGDEGRVQRQQQFMVALKNEIISPDTLLRIPDLCTAIMNSVSTDMSGNTLMKLMLSMGSDMKLEMYQPAGAGAYGPDGISYYYMYEGQTDDFFEALVTFADEVPNNQSKVQEDGSIATGENPATTTGTTSTAGNGE